MDMIGGSTAAFTAVSTVGFGNATTKPVRNHPKKARSGTTNTVASEPIGTPLDRSFFVADKEEESEGEFSDQADNCSMGEGIGPEHS